MKTTKILSVILAISMLACMFVFPVNAEEVDHSHIEIIFEEGTPEDVKERVTEYLLAIENGENPDETETYGLTCDLLGHKYGDPRTATVISHRVRTTSPRCLRKTYKYETCSRCDTVETTLLSSQYIVCCSET